MALTDRTRSTVVAVTAVAQVAVGALSQVLVDADSTNAAISADNRSPVTPAGWAFAVWGLIYTACLVLAVHQALPGQREREVHRRTGWWLAGAFTASTVWVPVFSTRTIWLAQLILLALVVGLAVAARRLADLGPASSTAERLALRLPVTLYLGWATLAAVAGFGATARSLGMAEEGVAITLVSLVLVLAATVFSIVVVRRFVALAAFVLTAGWALVAIVVGTSSTPVAVAAAVALVLVLAVLVVRARTSRHPGAVLLG